MVDGNIMYSIVEVRRNSSRRQVNDTDTMRPNPARYHSGGDTANDPTSPMTPHTMNEIRTQSKLPKWGGRASYRIGCGLSCEYGIARVHLDTRVLPTIINEFVL